MERHNGAVFQEAGNSFLRLLGQQTVTIRNQSDNTLATIYSDDGVTPKANPFTSGTDGEFFFYAANGRYKIQIGNPVFETREDILLHDPGETRLPTSSNDEAVARFNGTTGNVQNSSNGPFVDDNGRVFTHPSNGATLGGVLGSLNKPPNDDLNDVTGLGWYLANTAANRPTGSGTWFVLTSGDVNLRQLAFRFDSTQVMYTRTRVSGVWGAWVQIPTVNGFQMAAALDFRAEQSVASAATVNLGAVAGNFVQITGTTTITSFGTAPAGTWRLVRFAGALTLTHNGTSLILPGSANITTAANDTLIARSLGSGNWFVSHYHRASGAPLRGGGFQTTLVANNSANLAWSSLPTGARRLILYPRNLDPATDDANLLLTLTVGGTRQTGATDYNWSAQVWQATDATATRGSTGDSSIAVASGPTGFGISNAHAGASGRIVIERPESTSHWKHVDFKMGYIRAGADAKRTVLGTGDLQSNSAVDGFDLRMDTGNIASGEVDVYVEF